MFVIAVLNFVYFSPLFVTWKKGHRHDLRGCIGTFSRDLPLPKALLDYAEIRWDIRFPIIFYPVESLQLKINF